MLEYAQGFHNPLIEIYSPADALIFQYLFENINEKGLIETIEEEGTILRADLNGDLKKYYKGVRTTYTLYYDEQVKLDTLIAFKTAYDLQHLGNKVFLTPYSENREYKKRVLICDCNIDLSVQKIDAMAFANEGLIIRMKTVSLQKPLPIYDPNNIQQVYLRNFFYNY